MTVAPSIRLAIVGCGRVTETLHLPSLQQVAGVEVVALSDVSAERLNKLADRFHIKERHVSYQPVLENASVDAVAVCVPAHSHVQVALDVVSAGKHLFIEKPLALRLDDADLLIDRVKNSRLKAMVGFNLRRHRLIQQARQILQKSDFGKLQMIRSVLSGYHEDVPEWRKRRESGGGVLFEQAVHHFDLWRYLLGSEIEEVSAISRSAKWDDETATVTARLTNGMLASSAFSQVAKACNEVEIYGDERWLRVDCYRFDGLEHASSMSQPGSVKSRLKSIGTTLRALPRGILGLRYDGDFFDSYRAEWRHFVDAIRNDTPIESTLEDGRSALQAALAAVKSLTTGTLVKVCPASVAREQASDAALFSSNSQLDGE
jgi:predicted dehydrogenase